MKAWCWSRSFDGDITAARPIRLESGLSDDFSQRPSSFSRFVSSRRFVSSTWRTGHSWKRRLEETRRRWENYLSVGIIPCEIEPAREPPRYAFMRPPIMIRRVARPTERPSRREKKGSLFFPRWRKFGHPRLSTKKPFLPTVRALFRSLVRSSIFSPPLRIHGNSRLVTCRLRNNENRGSFALSSEKERFIYNAIFHDWKTRQEDEGIAAN